MTPIPPDSRDRERTADRNCGNLPPPRGTTGSTARRWWWRRGGGCLPGLGSTESSSLGASTRLCLCSVPSASASVRYRDGESMTRSAAFQLLAPVALLTYALYRLATVVRSAPGLLPRRQTEREPCHCDATASGRAALVFTRFESRRKFGQEIRGRCRQRPPQQSSGGGNAYVYRYGGARRRSGRRGRGRGRGRACESWLL